MFIFIISVDSMLVNACFPIHGYINDTSIVYMYCFLLYCVHSTQNTHATLDKLDAVGSFRRRKRRLSSEAEEEELSLTEYIRRKQEEENAGPKKKRVCETKIKS